MTNPIVLDQCPSCSEEFVAWLPLYVQQRHVINCRGTHPSHQHTPDSQVFPDTDYARANDPPTSPESVPDRRQREIYEMELLHEWAHEEAVRGEGLNDYEVVIAAGYRAVDEGVRRRGSDLRRKGHIEYWIVGGLLIKRPGRYAKKMRVVCRITVVGAARAGTSFWHDGDPPPPPSPTPQPGPDPKPDTPESRLAKVRERLGDTHGRL